MADAKIKTGTKAEYARQHKVSKASVTKWAQAGHLVMIGSLVDFEKSDAVLEKRLDPSKIRRKKSKADASEKKEFELLDDTDPGIGGPVFDEPVAGTDSYYVAKTKEKLETARLRELDRLEREGKLLPSDDVVAGISEVGKALQTSMLAMPGKLSAQLANIVDPIEVEEILETEVREILTDIATALDQAKFEKVET